MIKVLPLHFIPLLLVAMLACPGCSGKDPEYQGKTVSVWVSLLKNPDSEVKQNATNVLAELVSKDPKDPTVIRALIHGMKNGNYAAADMLSFIGKDAGDLTPEVVEGLAETMKKKGDLSTRLASARALPTFGTATGPAIPALIEMLKDDNPVIRESAAETLGRLPVDLAKQATPQLLAVAKNNNFTSVQQRALETLRIVDPEALRKAGGS